MVTYFKRHDEKPLYKYVYISVFLHLSINNLNYYIFYVVTPIKSLKSHGPAYHKTYKKGLSHEPAVPQSNGAAAKCCFYTIYDWFLLISNTIYCIKQPFCSSPEILLETAVL
jgi:hypothetical protein